MNRNSVAVPATLLALAIASAASAQSGASLKIGSEAPAIQVAKWVKGTPVTSLKNGKVNVVEFWATWCGPCKVSIPHLTELAKKYQGKANFVGVSIWEIDGKDVTKANYQQVVDKFVKSMGPKMNYNVAIDDAAGTMSKNWMTAANQSGIPTAFIVGKDGKVAWIGHPMEMEGPLAKIVAGTYNSKAEIARQARADEDQAAASPKVQKLRQLLQSGDKKGAIKIMDELIASSPQYETSLAYQKFMLMLDVDEAAAWAYGKKIADTTYKDNGIMLNNIAWAIVDDSVARKTRDMELAMKLAEKANKLTKSSSPYCLDTLAYIYYKKGKMSDAIKFQQMAVDSLKTSDNIPNETRKEITDRLAMYKKKAGASA